MNEAILFHCPSSFRGYYWARLFVILMICFVFCFVVVDGLNNYSSNVLLFLFLHFPTAFAFVYAHCETKLWVYHLINSSNNLGLCAFFVHLFDINENDTFLSTNATKQHSLKRWAKMSSIAYLLSLSFCFGLLLSAEDDFSIQDNILYLLWSRLFNLQVIFFLWLIIRFVLSPIIF